MKAILIVLLLLLSQPLLASYPDFMHCRNYGCKTTEPVSLNTTLWQQIEQLFKPHANTAAEEKQLIRRAIALFEEFTGSITGTSKDKGGNWPGSDIPNQQDCIDESTNTYQYLQALQQLGLLKFHHVGQKQRRIVWLWTHWTATIVDNDSDKVFAVDSWYRDNGEPPYLQEIRQWRKKADFSSELNP